MKLKYNKYYYIIGFLLPALIFIFLVFLIPNILNFIYAFTNWNLARSKIDFVGFRNFIELSKRGDLWKDVLTTLEYAFLYSIFENFISLTLALALEKTNRINGILRIIFFIPVVISSLAAGFMWKGILSSEGIINQLVSFFGIDAMITPLGSIKFIIIIIALISVWKSLGIPMFVYIAALGTVPQEMIEAAKIEGAGFLQIVKNIKLPLIGPAFTFNIVLSIIGGLSIFDIIMSLTKGGPGTASEVINVLMFSHFGNGRMGYATAVSLILFLLIAIIGIPLIQFLRKREIEL